MQEVISHLPARMNVAVDAHAGVGTFALHLAGRARQVIGFETERSSVASAQWTARANSIDNITYRTGRAEQLFPRLSNDLRPDLVLLDPPRAGCHPLLLKEIARRAVPLVIYVSCDPSTLARDIKLLSPTYRLTSARVVDLFPQTYHIETVALLEHNA
jgi:23S rRNA (uracil1939-C5)-methyltransferase